MIVVPNGVRGALWYRIFLGLKLRQSFARWRALDLMVEIEDPSVRAGFQDHFRFNTALTACTMYGAVSPYFSINWSGVADSA